MPKSLGHSHQEVATKGDTTEGDCLLEKRKNLISKMCRSNSNTEGNDKLQAEFDQYILCKTDQEEEKNPLLFWKHSHKRLRVRIPVGENLLDTVRQFSASRRVVLYNRTNFELETILIDALQTKLFPLFMIIMQNLIELVQ